MTSIERTTLPERARRESRACSAWALFGFLLVACGRPEEPVLEREPVADRIPPSTGEPASVAPPSTGEPAEGAAREVSDEAPEDVRAQEGQQARRDELGEPRDVPEPPPGEGSDELRQSIRRVVRMPWDRALVRAARSRRMQIQNLSWEDSGRYIGSSVGPNISDLTLEVIERTTRRSGRPRVRTHLLPVLRYPNFTDRTADVPAEHFWVRVGNHRAGAGPESLTPVPLSEVLAHLRDYLSDPDSLRSESDDFTAPRDTHYLVSAQHVFLPLPPGTRVEWSPVLFNYQSYPGAPQVLCLVVTREGTSITTIENRTDPLHPGGWGQRLYFNHHGRRALFTAERRSDVVARVEAGRARADDATALEEGADMVMIVQVPLRPPPPSGSRRAAGFFEPAVSSYGAGAGDRSLASDVERAVVGHGIEEGPFEEIRRRRIRRDPRFPIRVTVQFYRATSNGVVSEADLDAAVSLIERVYSEGEYVGSLVVGRQDRPTSWVRPGTRG